MRTFQKIIAAVLAIRSWLKRRDATGNTIFTAPTQPPILAGGNAVALPTPNLSPAAIAFNQHALSRKPRYRVECKSSDGRLLVLENSKRVRLFSCIRCADGRCYTVIRVKRIRPTRSLEWSSNPIPSPA